MRAFRPGATAMRVLPKRGAPVEMEQLDGAGLNGRALLRLPPAPQAAARLPARGDVGATDRRSSTTTRTRFPPALGELDMHLIGEGRHEELWERLGAHERELEGVAGTAFAVWAPAARSVSVVGDFNLWDGRVHPMRSLGSSGVWELFVPGIAPGTRYKFEIRHGADRPGSRPTRSPRAAELPPATASVVYSARPPLGRRRLARAPRRRRPPGTAALDLRGASRLLAPEPARGEPAAHLPRARRRARRLRHRPRLHPRRADAGDGASVRGLVGLPDDRLLRPDLALRHARRLPRARRPAAPGRDSA